VSALATTGLEGKESSCHYLLYCNTVNWGSLNDLCKLFRVTDDPSGFVFSFHNITTPWSTVKLSKSLLSSSTQILLDPCKWDRQDAQKHWFCTAQNPKGAQMSVLRFNKGTFSTLRKVASSIPAFWHNKTRTHARTTAKRSPKDFFFWQSIRKTI